MSVTDVNCVYSFKQGQFIPVVDLRGDKVIQEHLSLIS